MQIEKKSVFERLIMSYSLKHITCDLFCLHRDVRSARYDFVWFDVYLFLPKIVMVKESLQAYLL